MDSEEDLEGACFSEREASGLGLGASWADGGEAVGSSAGREMVDRSSSLSAITAIRVPTVTPLAPASC